MADFVLLVVDVQKAFSERDALGHNRSCPVAEQNIASLLTHFRAQQLPVIHIHHHSLEANSAFCADQTGAQVQPFATPKNGETVVVKHVNSGFIGTDLADHIQALGNPKLVICGATANHCVETTTRMAGNLGYEAFYVGDAVWAYDGKSIDGFIIPADQIHTVSMANLHNEFATVIQCAALLAHI